MDGFSEALPNSLPWALEKLYDNQLAVTTSIAFIAIVVLRKLFSKKLRLPPGPRPWPIVGNMFQIKDGLSDYSMALSKKYGPIVTMWVGPTPIIFVTGIKLAEEALIKQSAIFANRTLFPSSSVLTENHGIIISNNGEQWRMLRRVLLEDVLSHKALATYRQSRAVLIDEFIEKLKQEASSKNGIVEMRKILRLYVTEIVIDFLFGVRVEKELVESIDYLINESTRGLVLPVLGDFFPIFWLTVYRRRQATKLLKQRVHETFRPYLEKHRELRNSGNPMTGKYADALLACQSKTTKDGTGKITDGLILSLCAEFSAATMDSLLAALEWNIIHLVGNPDIYKGVQDEIAGVVGSRPVQESDVENLPYLQAFVAESMRVVPPAPTPPPRAVTKPTKLGGYDIPEKAMVFFHGGGFAVDPQYWVDPFKLQPERFLQPEKFLQPGITKVPDYTFGGGRRICPGKDLGNLLVRLFLARLIQTFDWSTPNGEPFEYYVDTESGSAMPTKALRARIKVRP